MFLTISYDIVSGLDHTTLIIQFIRAQLFKINDVFS